VVHADRLKPYEGPTLEPWAYKTPTPVERVNAVAGEGEDTNSEEVAGPSTSVATGSSVVLGTESNRPGEESSDAAPSANVTNNGVLSPEDKSDNSMQSQSVPVAAKQDKKRKKRVTFNPDVGVKEIPLVGWGMKVDGSWGKVGMKLDQTIRMWEADHKPPHKFGRRNPDRVRRKPARYR
jgi:hypothetical protein